MSDFEERRRQARRRNTWPATAETWLSKAVGILLYEETSGGRWERIKSPLDRAANAWNAWKLMYAALGDLELLVDAISDELIEDGDVERAAADLHRKLRDRRRALALANVSGRTPEEASAFRRKARELRS